jgi:5'(3')-deoxyribonucleotidase
MIVAVDIDNVINNLTEAVLEVYNADSGDNLTPDDIKAYHIENFIKSKYKETFHQYFLDCNVWKKIKVQPRCREVIAKLHNEGHYIIFVTTTEPENLPKKKNWLMRNFPFLNIRKSLYCCPVKQLVKCDILIDDCITNLVGERSYYSICMDMPYNQTDEYIPRFVRAYNWDDIYCWIKTVEKLIKEDENEQ